MGYRHTIQVRHHGLGKHRVISGTDRSLVEEKVRAQYAEWEHQYHEQMQAKALKDAVTTARLASKQKLERKKEEAEFITREAREALHTVRNLLAEGLKACSMIDWEVLKKKFSVPPPSVPAYSQYPKEPVRKAQEFQPKISPLTELEKFRMEAMVRTSKTSYASKRDAWVAIVESTQRKNEKLFNDYKLACERWNQDQASFCTACAAHNDSIEKRQAAYYAKEPEGVEDYCEMVLSKSDYPDAFPKDFDLEYKPSTQMLVVEYSLPAPDALTRIKEVRFVKSKDEFVEVELSEAERSRIYDDVLYQVVLRTVHELFTADGAEAIAGIVFNGWVRSTDLTTGKEVTACVLSLQVKRSEFLDINLSKVEPKACFKALKGVGSSKLHSLIPIAPVLQISREDKRFVPAHEVANQLDGTFNLAAMDWEDFEHLIRELFAAEFAHNGGEVKITQASKDRGVDAVAFDPDPIRGGKIVIQAKRYTNTVGVASVRDLYGTVMNEGATKGILVTTSDYGPDAYEFAAGKPLTLLNGANLLHLLEKHGHKAKIDIKEARRLLGRDE